MKRETAEAKNLRPATGSAGEVASEVAGEVAGEATGVGSVLRVSPPAGADWFGRGFVPGQLPALAAGEAPHA
jgi:hypothetical protein